VRLLGKQKRRARPLMLSVFRLVIVCDFNLLLATEKPCLLDRIFVFGPRMPLLRLCMPPMSWEVNPDKLRGLLVYAISLLAVSAFAPDTVAQCFLLKFCLVFEKNEQIRNKLFGLHIHMVMDVMDCTSAGIKINKPLVIK